MKKLFLPAMLLAGLVIAGCSHEEPEIQNPEDTNSGGINVSPAWDKDTITISFAPQYTTSPMESRQATRAVTSIASIATHLDVWIVNGSNVIDIHQTSGDDGFGTVQAVLDKTKTYTLYAVAHKADGAATLADGVISFPDDKVTHSMFYTTTFSPATTTSLSAEMTRIVAQFKLDTTDAIPDEAKKMRFTITDVWNRWNVSTGATNQLDRTSEMTISNKRNDGSAQFAVYAIVTDAETTHTVTISALDANDAVLQSRTFTGVTLRNGYKTTYRGAFFIDQQAPFSFSVGDWSEYDVVDF